MQTSPILNRVEMLKTLGSCDVCYIGMVDQDNMPYVLPFNFGLHGETLYFHSAPEGKKINILLSRPDVCIAFSTGHELYHQHEQVACSYGMKFKSVIISGKVEFIEDYDRKVEALNVIMMHYTGKEFNYNAPAVNNVKVYKVVIDKISGRKRG